MTDNHSISSNRHSPILAKDIKDVLLRRYAIFTGKIMLFLVFSLIIGGHDKEFRSLIIFQDRGLDGLGDDSYIFLMQYFSSLST